MWIVPSHEYSNRPDSAMLISGTVGHVSVLPTSDIGRKLPHIQSKIRAERLSLRHSNSIDISVPFQLRMVQDFRRYYSPESYDMRLDGKSQMHVDELDCTFQRRDSRRIEMWRLYQQENAY